MEALEILNFFGCSGLKKFLDIQGKMEHLLELYLTPTVELITRKESRIS